MSNLNYALAIHGGAGTMTREKLSTLKEKEVRKGLLEALRAGEQQLKQGRSAVEAVEAAVRSLEDNPAFNAGKGSVLTYDGSCRMDASIMEGKSRKAGAVIGITGIKNPVSLAKAVMQQSEYVLLSGQGAENFARIQHLEFVPADYFITCEQAEEWERKRAESIQSTPQPSAGFGTVGAVALDTYGNLAAATSTGGLTNMQFNRVGDTAIIGGGTYADNQTCAVSCTGDGEFIMRLVSAYDVSCLLEYKGISLAEACDLVIHAKLPGIGGEGGLIAIDHLGNLAMPYNSPSMYRGCLSNNQEPFIAIFEK